MSNISLRTTSTQTQITESVRLAAKHILKFMITHFLVGLGRMTIVLKHFSSNCRILDWFFFCPVHTSPSQGVLLGQIHFDELSSSMEEWSNSNPSWAPAHGFLELWLLSQQKQMMKFPSLDWSGNVLSLNRHGGGESVWILTKISIIFLPWGKNQNCFIWREWIHLKSRWKLFEDYWLFWIIPTTCISHQYFF